MLADFTFLSQLSVCVSGPDGWKTAVDNHIGPNDVLFRWSPKYQDLEVISTSSLPVYLNAPGKTRPITAVTCLLVFPSSSQFSLFLDKLLFSHIPLALTGWFSSLGPYLGHQLLSYGQNLSFSLRLDHGVRQPSHDDVILEGSGLRVAISLGALRPVAPCRQKVNYSFRWGPFRWRFGFSSGKTLHT